MLPWPGRSKPWRRHAYRAAFALGTALGGLISLVVLFFLSGFFRWLPLEVRLVLAVACAAACFGLTITGNSNLPQNRRMIPRSRFRSRAVLGFFWFGVELGTGVRTFLPTPAPHLIASLTVLGLLAWPNLLAISVGWGLGRTVPLFLHGTSFHEHGILTVSLTSIQARRFTLLAAICALAFLAVSTLGTDGLQVGGR